MSKDKKDKKDNKSTTSKLENIITVVCVFIICICAITAASIYAEQKKEDGFHYKDELDEIVITVGDEKLSLKEVSYYIMVLETQFNNAAVRYSEKNPLAFWNLKLRDNYFKNMAKEAIINACIRDNIYYQEAIKTGITLNEEELELVERNAVEEMNKLTKEQLEITEYEKNDMVQVLTKVQYAKKYVAELMKEGYTQEELDSGGSIYIEKADGYKISTNKQIWDNIRPGSVTINVSEED